MLVDDAAEGSRAWATFARDSPTRPVSMLVHAPKHIQNLPLRSVECLSSFRKRLMHHVLQSYKRQLSSTSQPDMPAPLQPQATDEDARRSHSLQPDLDKGQLREHFGAGPPAEQVAAPDGQPDGTTMQQMQGSAADPAATESSMAMAAAGEDLLPNTAHGPEPTPTEPSAASAEDEPAAAAAVPAPEADRAMADGAQDVGETDSMSAHRAAASAQQAGDLVPAGNASPARPAGPPPLPPPGHVVLRSVSDGASQKAAAEEGFVTPRNGLRPSTSAPHSPHAVETSPRRQHELRRC